LSVKILAIGLFSLSVLMFATGYYYAEDLVIVSAEEIEDFENAKLGLRSSDFMRSSVNETADDWDYYVTKEVGG